MTFTVSDSPCMPEDGSTMEIVWTAPLWGSMTVNGTCSVSVPVVSVMVRDPSVAPFGIETFAIADVRLVTWKLLTVMSEPISKVVTEGSHCV